MHRQQSHRCIEINEINIDYAIDGYNKERANEHATVGETFVFWKGKLIDDATLTKKYRL